MQKKINSFFLIFISVLLVTAKVKAQQLYPYDYSFSTQNYVALTNPTVLLEDVDWDDTTIDLSIPFPFVYQGVNITQWYLDTYGSLVPEEVSDQDFPAIAGLFADYESRPGSRIAMDVSGSTGSRIAKVEFRNVGFWGGSSNDSASFQIWLYEGSHKIEYHVGPSNISPGFFDPLEDNILFVGLGFDDPTDDSLMLQLVNYDGGNNTDHFFTVDIDNEDPTIIFDFMYHTEYPLVGSVFSFMPPENNTGIDEAELFAGKVYPNPASDRVAFELKSMPSASATIVITDMIGKQMHTQKVVSQKNVVDLSNFATGVYFYTFTDKGKTASGKFVKK